MLYQVLVYAYCCTWYIRSTLLIVAVGLYSEQVPEGTLCRAAATQ